jgi:hypothetical protein
MNKIYLKPGEEIETLTINARVGVTGTVADVVLDWSETSRKQIHGDEGFGTAVRNGGPLYNNDIMHFPVFVEAYSGRLYYDHDLGQ